MMRNDQDLLKVAKLNQDKSLEALAEARQLNMQAEKDIAQTEAFIAEIEKKFGIDSSKAIIPTPIDPLKLYIEEPTWEALVADANAAYPDPINFNDLLTQTEFENAARRLDEINAAFAHKTGFQKIDWFFLATAIALQCVRQYVLDPYLKNNRPKAGNNDEKGRKNNAEPGWYHVDTNKILISRVPFDAQGYSNHNSVQGFLKGFKNHRDVTLGHDPLLGWIFGTANILTNTLTKVDFQSAHIKNIPGKGNTIYALAKTDRIFLACKERLFDEGWDGKLAVGSAVIREAIHLKSDIYTNHSIPIPVVATVSPEFAKKLCAWGIDTASVSTEIALSSVINTLISMVHRLFYDESIDDAKMYEFRTRKILLYSNFIASTSNVIAVCITKNMKLFDLGGLIVTITRLFSDIRFAARVKQEFVESQLDINFRGIANELDDMYRSISY